MFTPNIFISTAYTGERHRRSFYAFDEKELTDEMCWEPNAVTYKIFELISRRSCARPFFCSKHFGRKNTAGFFRVIPIKGQHVGRSERKRAVDGENFPREIGQILSNQDEFSNNKFHDIHTKDNLRHLVIDIRILIFRHKNLHS